MSKLFGRKRSFNRAAVDPIKKINEAALALVASANEGHRGGRLVTKGSALEIVRRSLVRNENETFSVRKFRALKEVSEYITLAQRNKVITASAAHFDLLPVGHPSSQKTHRMAFEDVMRARARWYADDARVSDEIVSSLLATAFIASADSVEYQYATARLTALGAARVPVEALVAVALGFNDGANNGFWRQQLRSPKTGRWVRMFGLGSINLLDKVGKVFKQYFNIVSTDSRNGTVVGETPDGRLFRVGLDALDGGDSVKALLPSQSTPDGKSKKAISVSSSDAVVDEANLQFVDSPDGFTKGSSSPSPRGLDSNKVDNTWDDEFGNYQVVKGDFRGDGSDYVVSRLEQDSVTPIGVAKSWADTQKIIEADEPNFRDGKDAEPNLPEGMDLSPAPRGAADAAPAETPAGEEPKWKDRFGRTMPLGRPINFKVKNERGSEMDVYGEFVGDADKEGFGLVRVERNPQVPDGIYEVSSDNGGELLPSYKPEFLESVGIQQGKNDKGEDVAARTPEQIPSINEIVRRDFDPVDDSQRPEYEGWEAADFADEINEYLESQRGTILEAEKRAQGGDGFDDPPAGTPEERTENALAEMRSRVENLYSKEHWTYTKGDNQLIIHKRLALRDPEYAKEVAETANLLIENEPVPGGVTTYVSPGLKAKINALGVVNTFAAGDASPGKSGIFGRPTSINMYHRDSLNFRGLDNPLDVMGERLYVPFAYERMGENGRKRPTATLAHEWGHARDYNFGDEGGMEYSLKMKRLIEENPEYLDGVGWYGRTNTYEVVAEYYSQYIGEKYYGAEPMGIPQPIVDLFESKLATRDGDIDTQLKNALKNYKLKPNDRYTADGQRKNGAEDIFADKANPKKAQGKLEPTPEPETPQGAPAEPPTPEAPATPEPEDEYTPDELAAGWGFDKNDDGSYTGDGDDGAVDVSQLPNGKWLVERRLGDGEVAESGPFDSPEEAFDAAQIEAGRKGQFDDGAVEDLREKQPEPSEAPTEGMDLESLTPDELAVGYGFVRNDDGSFTFDSEDGAIDVSQLDNGKWLVERRLGDGEVEEFGPFDSHTEAFDVAQIEAGRGGEFDEGAVEDFRDEQGDTGEEPATPEGPEFPEGMYRVDRGPYTPQGPQDGVESEDYTDDPVELAQRFDSEELEGALEEAVRNGEGEALLPFEAGDEYVPAEALYSALKEQDRDPDQLLDNIYDGAEPSPEPEDAAPEDVVDEGEERQTITPEEVAELRAENDELLPALLDGLSDEEIADILNNEDYSSYLPENEEFDVPEGMYEIDPDPVDPADDLSPADAPEGAPNNPFDMAVDMSTEDLENGLRGAIQEDEDSDRLGYYPIAAFDEDGEEFIYDVPAEAWRDALQLRGVDTNEILREAYSGDEMEPEEVEDALVEEGEEPIAEGEGVPEELLEEPFDPAKALNPDNVDKVPVGGAFQIPLMRLGRTPEGYVKLQRTSDDQWLETIDIDGSSRVRGHDDVRSRLSAYGERGDDGMRPIDIDGKNYSFRRPEYLGVEDVPTAETAEEAPTPEAPEAEAPRKEMKSQYVYQGGAAFLRGGVGAPFRDPEIQEYIRSKGFDFVEEWNGKRVYSEIADLSLPEFKEVLRELRDRFGVDLAPRFEGSDIDIDAPDEEVEAPAAPEAPEAEAVPSPPITSRFGKEISNDWVEDNDNAFDVNDAPIVGDIQVGDFIPAADGGWHEVINLEPDPDDPDGVIVTKMRLSNGEIFRGRKTTKRSPGLGWANGKEISGLRRRKDFDGLSRDEIEGRAAQTPEEMLSNSPAPEAPAPSAGTGGRPTRSGAFRIPRPVRPAFLGRVQDIVNGLDEKNGPNLWEALKNERLVAFDFETVGTGNFDYDNPDEPVALAAYVYEKGKLVDEISLFMNPDRGLGEWYYVDGNVGGDMKPERMLDAEGNPITDEWLATQPGIEEQIKKFLEFAGPNAIYVAQNAEFDTSMLEFWARKNGVDFTANDVIDTLPIADSLFGKGKASLGKIADQLGIEVDPNMLHNAGTDASILHEALGKMLAMMDGNNREFDLERANAAYEAGLAQYKFNVAQKQGQNADSKVDPADADDLDDTPLAITSVFGDEISNDWVDSDENTSLMERVPTGDVRVGDFVAAKGGGWHEIVAIDPDPVSEDAVILTKRRLATGEVKRGRDTASSAGILGWFKNTPLTIRRRLTDADLPSTEEQAPVVDLVDKVDAPEVPTTKEEAAAVVGEAIDSAIDNNNNVSDNVDAPAIEAAQEGTPAEVIVDANRQGFSDVHLDANGTPLREGDRVRHVKSGRIGTVRTPMEVFKSGNYMYNNYMKVHFDDAPKREPIGANRLELISEGTDSPNDYSDVTPEPAEIPETPPVTPETSTEPPAEVADETGLTDAEKAERLAALQALDPMSDVNDELETSNTYEVNITPARARALVYAIGEKYSGASWGDESNGGTAKENKALNRLEELLMPLQSKGGKIQITPREMWVIQSEILPDLNYYKEASEDGYITSEERGNYKALLNLNNELSKIRKDLGLVGTPKEAFNKEREVQRKYDNLVEQRETRAAELQLEQDYAADLRDEETPTVEDLDRDPEEYAEEQYPPTKEQRRIISAIMTGKSVIVRALAGTGKTSTLKLAAKRLLSEQPDKKIVYVAFNKTVQEEANSKMPANVEARTADSIAFRWAPKEMTAKYTNQKNNSIETARTRDEIAEALGIPKELRTVSWQTQTRQDGTVLPAGSFDTVDQIRSIIDAWTISDKDSPEIPRDVLSGLVAHSKENPGTKSAWFRDLVDGYVEDLQSPIGVLPINNGHITKFWALSNPDLSKSGSGLARKADIVFFDEAQDINPVLAKVIADQKMQKVYVGDGNQAIYGFRGAVDQLDKTEAPFDLPMTQSFRFGPQVAGLANRFLEGLGSPYRLRGSGPDGEVRFVEKPDAILARTNAGVIKEALSELNNGNSVAVPLSTKDELKALVRTVRWFKEGGNRPRSLHPDLAEFKDWGAAQDAGNAGDNPKVRSLVTLVEDTFEGDLNELEDFVDNLLVESQVSKNVGSAPTSALDGESGELGADIDWRVEGTNLIFFGKGTWQSKDLIKSVQHEGWGPRWNGDDKYWFFNVEDDDTRLEVLGKVRNAVVGTSGADENVTVITTAHKSKGLEWDTVRLSDDFFTPRENPDGTMSLPSPEEMRLSYVALTRGREAIDPGSLEWIYDYTSGDSESPDRGSSMEMGMEMAAPNAGNFDSTEVGDNIADTATKLDKASEEVADLIISLLEKGVAPWQKPWTGGAFLPTNYATGRSYNGLNIWTLLGTMELKGYSDNRWMTFAQAKKLGGFVRKGEKSTPVIYMSPIIKKKIDEKTGEEKEYKIWTSRIYRVFNVAQIDGIDIEPQQEKPPVPVSEAETTLLEAYKDKPQVVNTPQDQAYYSPFEDVIRIPLREQFDTPAGYFETLAHELAHSTAHKSRLDRTALTDNYGSHKASRGLEELIAEISVALVAGRLNADYQIESVAAYADSWLNALQRDKSMILKATRAAQAATDYMLGDYGKNQGKNRIPDSEEPTDDQAEPNVGESGKTGEQIAEETQGEAPQTSEDRNVGESGETGEEIAREDQTSAPDNEFVQYSGFGLDYFYRDLEVDEFNPYTPLVADAVDQYQNSPEFLSINKGLRDDDPDVVNSPIVEKLDEAVRRGATLTQDTTLWRAIRMDIDQEGAQAFDELQQGDIIEHRGYVSTTANLDWAVDFTRKYYSSTILQIQVPAGTRGMVPYLSTNNLLNEYEFVLPRGTRFQVVSRNPATRIITVRIV